MAVDKIEFGKKYYEIGYSTKENNPNHEELRKQYPNLRLIFAVVATVMSDDYDAIVQVKGQSHGNLVTYRASDFGTTYEIDTIKPGHSLFDSLEEAEKQCDFINTNLNETMGVKGD